MAAQYFYLETEGGDNITTEGGDNILLYSFASETSIMYGLKVDWSGDGSYNYGSEEDYMLKWTADRGRDRLIGAPGSGFEPYRVGTLRVQLDNSTGRYNPYYTSGDLYGNLEPGDLVKFEAAVYSSTATNGYISYNIFAGFVSDVVPQGWNKTAYLECEDGLGMLKGKEIEQVGTGAYEEDVAAWISNITTKAGYPYSISASTDDPTTDDFITVMYISPNDALDELQKLTSATLGSIAAEGDGTLAYHSIYESDSAVTSLTDSNTLNNPYMPNPWENLRDSVVIHGYWLDYCFVVQPFVVDSRYSANPYISVDAGDSITESFKYFKTFGVLGSTEVFFNYYIGGVNETDYTLSIQSSTSTASSDTLESTGISATWDYAGVNFVTLTFTNETAQTRYIHTAIFVNGSGFQFQTRDANFTYGSTETSWNNGEFVIRNNLYYSVVKLLFGGGTYYSKVVETDIQQARLDNIGNLLSSYLSTSQPHPVVQLEGRTETQLILDVEKKVTYTSSLMGIDSDYRIAGLRHETLNTPQAIRTTVYLYPPIPSST